MISINKTHSLLVAAGAVLGVVVPKALASEPARKLAVNTVAAGMRVKAGYEDVVEQAKAQVDDIVAEASYLNGSEDEACDCGCKAGAEKPADAKAE